MLGRSGPRVGLTQLFSPLATATYSGNRLSPGTIEIMSVLRYVPQTKDRTCTIFAAAAACGFTGGFNARERASEREREIENIYIYIIIHLPLHK